MDKNKQLKNVHLTKDGSHTFYIEALDEYYHSLHGAIQESDTVFIKAGLHAVTKSEIHIFEMGFGTGLNAFMTYLEAKKTGKKIHYYTIEAYPISLEEAKTLNFHKELNAESEYDTFLKMHQENWNEKMALHKDFNLFKVKGKLEDLQIASLPKFDLIYFDAFAPSAQPHLWEIEMLKKMYEILKPEGILTTYCAKGIFKRTLKEVGFAVESLPGPIGKREITRASKQ